MTGSGRCNECFWAFLTVAVVEALAGRLHSNTSIGQQRIVHIYMYKLLASFAPPPPPPHKTIQRRVDCQQT